MDTLSVLKAELTEAGAKVSALENAIKVFGGKSGKAKVCSDASLATLWDLHSLR